MDYVFLMLYAADKGLYYLHLEDDVLSNSGSVGSVLAFAAAQKQDVIVIGFGPPGRIGFTSKLLKTRDLPQIALYFYSFYWTKPVDWLLDDFVHQLSCRRRVPYLPEACKTAEKQFAVTGPYLFKHIGTESSKKLGPPGVMEN